MKRTTNERKEEIVNELASVAQKVLDEQFPEVKIEDTNTLADVIAYAPFIEECPDATPLDVLDKAHKVAENFDIIKHNGLECKVLTAMKKELDGGGEEEDMSEMLKKLDEALEALITGKPTDSTEDNVDNTAVRDELKEEASDYFSELVVNGELSITRATVLMEMLRDSYDILDSKGRIASVDEVVDDLIKGLHETAEEHPDFVGNAVEEMCTYLYGFKSKLGSR